MTVTQALKIMDVRKNSSRDEIEQTYTDKLRSLHRLLAPGQPLAVREMAQEKIIQLKTAFEVLNNKPAQYHKPVVTQSHRAQKPKPVGSSTRQASPVPARQPFGAIFPISNRLLGVSFLIAIFVMILVILLCVGFSAERITARVGSVSQSRIQADKESLSRSGQVDAFRTGPVECKLTLHQGNKVISRVIQLPKNSETLVQIELEKGQIDVKRQPHNRH